MQDTSEAAANFYHAHLRGLAPGERLRIAAGLSMAVRQLAEAGVRLRHPDASPRELAAYVAVRLYGRQIAAKVLGDIPDDAR